MDFQEVIDILEKAIPLRPPTLSWEAKDMYYYAGQRSVIDLLKRLNEEQGEQLSKVIKI